MSDAIAFDADPGVSAVFTSCESGNLSLLVGDGDAARARAHAVAGVGATLDDAVFMQQVHGGRVAVVGEPDRGRGSRDADDAIAGVDALVTTDCDVALAVLVADCVPVLLCDPQRAIGAVHAGRRGVAAGVVGTAVAALAQDPSQVAAVIGPAIGGCCYEVSQSIADEVTAIVPAAKATTTWGTPSLDLVAAVESQLADAGVGTVARTGSCTRCSADRWFSHRATAEGAVQGRQAGFIVRRSEGPPCL